MFKCCECGLIFDEPYVWTESYGQKFSGCPHCHSYFEEAEMCKSCGEWCTPDELTSGVCDTCIYELKEYVNCKDIFEGETISADIDYLAYVLLGEATINDILKKYLSERLNNADCTEAIEEDKMRFAELMVEKMKGDK